MRVGVAAAIVDGTRVEGDVEVEDGRVAAVGLAGGGAGIAAPGFVDLQVNGFRSARARSPRRSPGPA
jgi:N-acetylglucosamine-6-phosphate deacetylase